MVRLRNERTGAVVNVSDDKAAKLTAMFVTDEDAEASEPKRKPRAKKSED